MANEIVVNSVSNPDGSGTSQLNLISQDNNSSTGGLLALGSSNYNATSNIVFGTNTVIYGTNQLILQAAQAPGHGTSTIENTPINFGGNFAQAISGPIRVFIPVGVNSQATLTDLHKFGFKVPGFSGSHFGIKFTATGASIVVTSGNNTGSGTALSVDYPVGSTVGDVATAIDTWMSTNTTSLYNVPLHDISTTIASVSYYDQSGAGGSVVLTFEGESLFHSIDHDYTSGSILDFPVISLDYQSNPFPGDSSHSALAPVGGDLTINTTGQISIETTGFVGGITLDAGTSYQTGTYSTNSGVNLKAGGSSLIVSADDGKVKIQDSTQGTAGYVLTSIDTQGTASWLPSSAPKVAFIYDQQAQGANGGTASTTGWDTRVLNTLVDPSNIVTSLTSNVITLPAGTYEISADLVVNGLVNYTQSRFRNTSDNTTPALGNLYFDPYSAGPCNHHVGGIFTIASTKTFELQSLAGSSQGTLDYGQGGGSSFNTASGELGCFATLKIVKLA